MERNIQFAENLKMVNKYRFIPETHASMHTIHTRTLERIHTYMKDMLKSAH